MGRSGKSRPEMTTVEGKIVSVKVVEREWGRRRRGKEDAKGTKVTVYSAKVKTASAEVEVMLGRVEAWKEAGVEPKKGMKVTSPQTSVAAPPTNTVSEIGRYMAVHIAARAARRR